MHDADRSTHFMCIHFTFHKIPIQFIVKEIKLHVIDYCINLEVRFEFVLYYYEYMKDWCKSDIHVFDTIRFIPCTVLSEELSFVQLCWLIESIPIATCIYLHSLSIFPLFCKKLIESQTCITRKKFTRFGETTLGSFCIRIYAF